MSKQHIAGTDEILGMWDTDKGVVIVSRTEWIKNRTTYCGTTVRKWFYSPQGMRPTREGIDIPDDKLDQLIELLQQSQQLTLQPKGEQ